MNRLSALAEAASGEEICAPYRRRKGQSLGFYLDFELSCYEKEENEAPGSLRGSQWWVFLGGIIE